MLRGPPSSPAIQALFATQILSLVVIGVLTVSLMLAAYAIGGDEASGRILGLILALKMVANFGLAPLAGSFEAEQSGNSVLIGLDPDWMLLPMVLVAGMWQIAILACVFYSLFASFTPHLQAFVPDLLPGAETYTLALAYSRIAHALEAVPSPVIAAAALLFVAAQDLFGCAALAFVGSVAVLMVAGIPPVGTKVGKGPFLNRAFKAVGIYTRMTWLRGLLLLKFSVSRATAWVLANRVAYAGMHLDGAGRHFPIMMANYGFGPAIGAVIVPRLSMRTGERVSW